MQITPVNIENYCREHSTPLPALFDEMRAATYAELHAPQMQVGMLEGNLLKMLVALSGARRVLEFGTFSGYSALAMAEALPEDGELITCDIDARVKDFTARFWSKSPHGKKIRLELGPGRDTLGRLKGPFDLVFIDADKAGYRAYWDGSLPLLRPGGLMVVDNVLWSGRVLDPQEKSDHEIHGFNEYAKQDPRVDLLMLPIRDGILLGRKKA
jgi:caffeoyl-CoA O-methyltransferase